MSVRTTVKSIQDIMRQDVGVDGDAQRISQLCWMFFLKIIDDQDQELELHAATATARRSRRSIQWRTWAADPEGITGEALLAFVNGELFPALKNLPLSAKPGDRRRVVRDVFEDAYNYMKSGQLMRQVVNKINGVDFNNLDRAPALRRHLRADPQRPAIGRQRRRVLHAARRHRLHGRPHRPAARRNPARSRLRHRRLPHLRHPPHARALREAARGRAEDAGRLARGGEEAASAHALRHQHAAARHRGPELRAPRQHAGAALHQLHAEPTASTSC